MKLLVSFLFTFCLSSTTFAQSETVTVTGSRISPDASPSSFPNGRSPGRANLEYPRACSADGGEAGFCGSSGGGGVRVGCQECQSVTAFYSCKVWKGSPINETWDKTLTVLTGQNCCKNQGGNVLSTRLGNCG